MAQDLPDRSPSPSDDTPLAVVTEVVRRWSTGEPADDLVIAAPEQSTDQAPPFAWINDPEHSPPEERRQRAEAAGMRMRARSVTEGSKGWVLVEAVWSLDGTAARGTAGLAWFAVRVADGRVVEIHASRDQAEAQRRTGATAPDPRR